jgi:hypothetical protein
MIRMTFALNQQFFDGQAEVTCYMCHRGDEHPVKTPESLKPRAPKQPMPVLSAADGEKPAGQVFKNLKMLGGIAAKNVSVIMDSFTAELGVECAFCHDESKWESDANKHKNIARSMIRMSTLIAQTYYPGKDSPVDCYTCHQGQKEPRRTPQKAASVPTGRPGPG